MGERVGELSTWFKSLSITNKIIYAAAFLCSAIGVAGCLIYYIMLRAHYSWLYQEKLVTATQSLADWINKFAYMMNLTMFFTIITVVLLIIAIIFWFKDNTNKKWRNMMYSVEVFQFLVVVFAYVLCSMTKSKLEGTGSVKCNVLEAYEFSKYAKSGETLESKQKWCSKATLTHGAFATILLIGTIASAVSLFIFKQDTEEITNTQVTQTMI